MEQLYYYTFLGKTYIGKLTGTFKDFGELYNVSSKRINVVPLNKLKKVCV